MSQQRQIPGLVSGEVLAAALLHDLGPGERIRHELRWYTSRTARRMQRHADATPLTRSPVPYVSSTWSSSTPTPLGARAPPPPVLGRCPPHWLAGSALLPCCAWRGGRFRQPDVVLVLAWSGGGVQADRTSRTTPGPLRDALRKSAAHRGVSAAARPDLRRGRPHAPSAPGLSRAPLTLCGEAGHVLPVHVCRFVDRHR